MTGVLEGLKVLEMGHVVAMPAATATLADWGADVIKIEPLTGEMARGFKIVQGGDTTVKGKGGETSWYVHMLNRNKKSLAVNLKTEPGKEIIYKLIKDYDIFASNYELNSLKRLKMDYTTMSQINPELIYAVLTGYGTVGPDKDERGFDYAAAWAHSGMQYMIGEPGCIPPPQRGGMMDRVTGAHIVAGILAALLHREKTGEGQHLELSLYHVGVWTLLGDIQSALMGTPQPKHERAKAPNPLFNTYRTKDDRWLWLSMLQSDLSWSDFCRAIERPELENNPRFNSIEMRQQNCEELIRIIDESIVSKTMDEWDKILRKNNCIYSRVQTPLEVTTDPQAIANGFFAEVPHPVVGKMKLVTTPVKFYPNSASLRTPAPEVGQHTEEILLDLGYSWDDIAQLKEQGVIL